MREVLTIAAVVFGALTFGAYFVGGWPAVEGGCLAFTEFAVLMWVLMKVTA